MLEQTMAKQYNALTVNKKNRELIAKCSHPLLVTDR